MQIFIGIGQFLLVVAISFVALSVLVAFLRFQNLAAQAVQRDREAMDPNDAFQVHIAHRLGTAHRAPEPFCVMLLAPDSFSGLAEQLGEAGVQELMTALEKRIRTCVRSADEVIHCGGERIGLILGTARKFVEPVARRVLDAIEGEPIHLPSGRMLPVTACAGIVSHPENGGRLQGLVEQSETALETARGGGASSFTLAGAASAAPAGSEPPLSAPKGLLDPVSGVLRSERIGTAVQKYLARHRHDRRPVSILIVEIDHFDRYVERYGREAGDAILKGLGDLLQRTVREDDLIGRTGAHEFLLALVCSAKNALIAAQRISGAVKRAVFPVAGSSLKITLSIGIAGYPDHGVNPGHLFDAASVALAAAREKGRNMCLLYDPSMSIPPAMESQTDSF